MEQNRYSLAGRRARRQSQELFEDLNAFIEAKAPTSAHPVGEALVLLEDCAIAPPEPTTAARRPRPDAQDLFDDLNDYLGAETVAPAIAQPMPPSVAPLSPQGGIGGTGASHDGSITLKQADLQERLESHLDRLLAQLDHEEPQAAMADDHASNPGNLDLPEPVRDFLNANWEILNEAAHAHGDEHESSKAALALRNLIHTVEPRNWGGNSAESLRIIPGLLKRLKDGMQNRGLPQETRDRILTGLAKCQNLAIHLGRQLMQAQVARPEDAEAGEKASASGESRQADRFDKQVKALKRGAWIEFMHPEGYVSRAKLNWISPSGGLFVFTNQAGQRAMTMNAETLAAQFRDSLARLAEDVGVGEEMPAVNTGKLQHAA